MQPDFQKAELALSASFPQHFKDFFTQHKALVEELHQFTDGDDSALLSINADWLIHVNAQVRDPKNPSAFIGGIFVIAHDGPENLTVISDTPEDKRVWVIYVDSIRDCANDRGEIDWENEEIESYPNLETYVREQIDLLNELEDWE